MELCRALMCGGSPIDAVYRSLPTPRLERRERLFLTAGTLKKIQYGKQGVTRCLATTSQRNSLLTLRLAFSTCNHPTPTAVLSTSVHTEPTTLISSVARGGVLTGSYCRKGWVRCFDQTDSYSDHASSPRPTHPDAWKCTSPSTLATHSFNNKKSPIQCHD